MEGSVDHAPNPSSLREFDQGKSSSSTASSLDVAASNASGVQQQTEESFRGEETHSPNKLCPFCEQQLLPEQRPFVQLENAEEADFLCWRKRQDSAPPTVSEAATQLAWEKLCEENRCSCRICGALPEVGQQLENNLCDDCKFSLKNFDPTNS